MQTAWLVLGIPSELAYLGASGAGTRRALAVPMEDQELTVLKVTPENDPGGARLRAALEAHFESQRMHVLHVVLLYGTGLFGVPLWIATAWPGLLPAGLRHLSLLIWAFSAVGCVLSRIGEVHWQRRLLDEEATLARPRTVSS